MNSYALESLARDRLDRARAEAARVSLLKQAGGRAPRPDTPVSLEPLLIGLGRWLRGAEALPELTPR